MAAVVEDSATPVSNTATLSVRQRLLLSQILQDIRTTVQHLSLPDVNPLSATDATAVDALKDLYYMLNVEDSLNALPARQFVFASRTAQTLLHPIIVALHSHPSSGDNQKRWSVPTYQALRTLCVLSTPIPDANQFLPRGCALDVYCRQLSSFLAHNAASLEALVSLLQYYLEGKAAKIEALASAESCRLEDARIDNILTFFRNILSPPRIKQGNPLLTTDLGTHLALVSALQKADFYTTLSVLFSSSNPDEMRLHTTNTVFITADIYAFTFRHSSPKSISHTLRSHPYLRQPNANPPNGLQGQSTGEYRIPPKRTISKTRASMLRTALLKERAAIGGSRAVTAGARWSNRHSGGFSLHKVSDPDARPATVAVPMKSRTKRIMSSKAMVQSKISFNPKRPFQEAVLVNSQVLCLWASKKRYVKLSSTAGRAVEQVRKDLQDSGLKALVKIASELIDTSFSNFVREMRDRIDETKERTKRENPETLTRAQTSFLSLVGCVVGFQRERYGKVRKEKLEEARALNAEIHQNYMKAVLSADFKILKKEWKTVDAAIEVETFKIAFRVLVESFEALKNIGKDEANIESIEVATFALLEMMKMLQGMSAHAELQENENLEQTAEANTLTSRELALNTLEDLFREEIFLNAPANLAKDFNSKVFSFRHLSNIVEFGYTFTSMLMDEEELHRLQVTKKKRNRKKKIVAEEGLGKEGEEPQRQLVHEGENECLSNDNLPSTDTPPSLRRARKVKRVTDNSDDDEDVVHDVDNARRVEGMNEALEQSKAVEKPESEASPTNTRFNDEPSNVLPSTSETPKVDESTQPLEPPAMEIGSHSMQEGGETEKQKTSGEGYNRTATSSPKSDLRQVLDEGAGVESKGLSPAVQGKVDKSSPIKEMLRADAQAEAKIKAKEKSEKAKRMLMADVENEGKTLQAKFVSTINEAISTGISLGRKEGTENGNIGEDVANQSGESDDEPEMREMESMGIIRRFAHIRAIHTFTLPIRAMMCNSVALTGESYPIPDGAKMLLSPLVVAKSTHLLTSIWKVAKLRERGSLCGQFFTLGNMQFMEIMLNAPQHCNVKQFSVLESLGALARDVTRTFFEWLTINPGLTLDMVFGMDKGSCQMYTSYIRQKKIQAAKKHDDKESGNDSDVSQLAIAPPPRHICDGDISRSQRSRGLNSQRKKAARRRKRPENPKFESDEDVDDLDNLNIGIMDSDDGSDDGHDGHQKASILKAQTPNATNSKEPFLEKANPSTAQVRTRKRDRRRLKIRNEAPSGFQEKRQGERPQLDEDEDVDDLDNLNFGISENEDLDKAYNYDKKVAMSNTEKKSDGKVTVDPGLHELHNPCLYAVHSLFTAAPGIRCPLRTVFIQLPDGKLLVYSPTNPDLLDLEAVQALGEVTVIIAPNSVHSTYAQRTKEAFPNATLYSSPALKSRFPDTDWGTIVSSTLALSEDVILFCLSEMLVFQEIVLVHIPSRTLVIADTAFNISRTTLRGAGFGVNAFVRIGRGMGPMRTSVPLMFAMWAFCSKSKPQFDELLSMPWDSVVPCHGDIIEGTGKEAFRNGIYRFISSPASQIAARAWPYVVLIVAPIIATIAYARLIN
ncbi:unnamed protein product [Agarophyton chilense]